MKKKEEMKKDINLKSEDSNKKRYVFLVIVIIVLVLIVFFLLFKYMNRPAVPTGNFDIFDITAICPTCKVCKVCPTCNECKIDPVDPVDPIGPIDPIKPDPSKPVKPVEPTDPDSEENTPGFNVFDDRLMWQSTNELRIFTNPAYVVEHKIAPGLSNSYVFRIRNNNDFNVKYAITFIEENESNINMKYKLKYKNSYIKGNENTWVSYDKLNMVDIDLGKSSYDEYILEWKWLEGSNDTQIGIDADASYKISIEITGVEYENN